MFTVKAISEQGTILISMKQVRVIPYSSDEFKDFAQKELESMIAEGIEEAEYMVSQYHCRIIDVEGDANYTAVLGENVYITDMSGKTVYKIDSPDFDGVITSEEQLELIAGE